MVLMHWYWLEDGKGEMRCDTVFAFGVPYSTHAAVHTSQTGERSVYLTPPGRVQGPGAVAYGAS